MKAASFQPCEPTWKSCPSLSEHVERFRFHLFRKITHKEIDDAFHGFSFILIFLDPAFFLCSLRFWSLTWFSECVFCVFCCVMVLISSFPKLVYAIEKKTVRNSSRGASFIPSGGFISFAAKCQMTFFWWHWTHDITIHIIGLTLKEGCFEISEKDGNFW